MRVPPETESLFYQDHSLGDVFTVKGGEGKISDIFALRCGLLSVVFFFFNRVNFYAKACNN